MNGQRDDAEDSFTRRGTRGRSASLDAQASRLDAAARRIAALRRRTAADVRAADPAELELAAELGTVLHELQTAHEQLRRQTLVLERARAQVDAERARFRELFEVSREGYVVTDTSGVIRECNRAAGAILNVPLPYLVGKPLGLFVDQNHRRDFRVRTYRATTQDAEQEWSTVVTPRDVPPVDVTISLDPIADERGNTTELRWLLRSKSDGRAALVTSREPAAIVRAALDALSAHVAVLDTDGHVITVNRAWQAAEMPAGLFGSEAAPGADYLELCQAAIDAGRDGAGAVRDAVQSVLHAGLTRADALYAGGTADASAAGDAAGRSWYALRVTRCDGPEPVTAVLTHEDVTAERQAYARERALLDERAARMAAETANRAKSEFLATLSHELRTPLNAIAGYAQLLEMGVRGPVTLDQAEDLRRILRSERHLLGLINELLNFARLERGDARVDLSRVEVERAVVDVLELVEPQATNKSLRVVPECREPAPVAIADAEKLRQILLNLLSNSLKFTRAGGTIRVICDGDADHVYVRVEDTGIGIPSSKLEAIFDPFVQVHRAFAAPMDGIGLGLAISRTLARAMGGDLTVTSTVAEGSTFELSLPRAAKSAALT